MMENGRFLSVSFVEEGSLVRCKAELHSLRLPLLRPVGTHMKSAPHARGK